MVQYCVLFHLDEGSTFRLNLVLSNIRNLLADLGKENVSITLVVNGPGVKMFQKEICPDPEEVRALTKQDVIFAICENSLYVYDIKKELFLDEVMFVPSGVSELVKKQKEGWVYIKP